MRKENLERVFLRRLPELQLAVVVPALVMAVFARDDLVRILALGVALAWTLLLIPPAIACLIVTVMKGPRRLADSYPLPDAEAPLGKLYSRRPK